MFINTFFHTDYAFKQFSKSAPIMLCSWQVWQKPLEIFYGEQFDWFLMRFSSLSMISHWGMLTMVLYLSANSRIQAKMYPAQFHILWVLLLPLCGTTAHIAHMQIHTIMTLIIRTKLNNFISGVRILWNTLINDFSPEKGGVRIISGYLLEN